MRRILGLVAAVAGIAATTTPASAAQLVVNGDFSAGNTGFASDYADRTSGPNGILNSSYAIGTNAATVPNTSPDWGGFGDHTTGTGNMLIADGGLGRAWYQTISVVAGTIYDWSFWAHTVQGNTGNGALLYLEVDGSAISGVTMPNNSSFPWLNVFGTYTAQTTGVVTLSISDANAAGPYNDFALDDISFASPDAPDVPEPSTWAMMLAGFGAIGAALRRRTPARATAS